MDQSRQFNFHSVTIYNHERRFRIGCGSFGVVCKARCDGAFCAAKILRDLLCDISGQPTEQFHREIRLLREINHPNIVQYLGVHRDDTVSQMPILLMELMDCNLTNYLKDESVIMISDREQLGICHDIVLALEFLHFNHIVHRDLSGNNILLSVGDSRKICTAKVGDFGMAKVYDMAASNPNQLSTCPGTVAYMPPEALKDEPHYTEKIDCFSFGVLVIQILTRLYPDPSKEQYVPVEGSCSQNLFRQVSEVERRKNHINKIDSNNPLLSIAIACLSNSPDDRPTAIHIREMIERLKAEHEGKLDVIEHQKMIVDDLESPTKPVSVENAMLEKHEVKAERATKFIWINGIRFAAPCEMSRYSNSTMDKNIVYLLPVESTNIYAYDTAENQWTLRATSRYLGSSLTFINNELTTIGGKRLDVPFRYEDAATAGYVTCYTNKLWSLNNVNVKSADWINKLPSMPTKRAFTIALTTAENLIVAGGVGGAYLTTVEIMDIERSQWMVAADLPQKMWGVSGTLCGDSIYLLGGVGEKNIDLSTVFTCSVKNLLESCKSTSLISQFTSVFRSSVRADTVWKRLADIPFTKATCVSVHNNVLAIGGKDSNAKPTTDIHMYDQVTHTWIVIDHIPSARYSCFAVVHDSKVFVVGGNIGKGTPTNTMSVASVTTSN